MNFKDDQNFLNSNFSLQSLYSKEEPQPKQRFDLKKSIFSSKKVDQSSPPKTESPGGQSNRKKSILKNTKQLKKENSSQFDSAEEDTFETFMNLFNSSKHTRKPVNN